MGTTHAILSILIKAVSPRWELTWTRHHRDRAVQRGTVDLTRPHSWSVDQGGLQDPLALSYPLWGYLSCKIKKTGSDYHCAIHLSDITLEHWALLRACNLPQSQGKRAETVCWFCSLF